LLLKKRWHDVTAAEDKRARAIERIEDLGCVVHVESQTKTLKP